MKILKAAVIASSVLMTSGVGAQARDLTVVSWGGNFQDAQRKIFFEAFAKETGKPVLDESWEGGYGVLQAKVKAGVPNWDVVEVEAEELALGCADGIYEKIDWQKMGGKEAYLPAAVSDCGGFGLIMCHENNGQAQSMMDVANVHLHLLAKLFVQGPERFIHKNHFGFEDERSPPALHAAADRPTTGSASCP